MGVPACRRATIGRFSLAFGRLVMAHRGFQTSLGMSKRTIIRVLGSAMTAVALLSGSARAAERAGVQMADTVNVRGQNLVLNGLGVREASAFKVDVYVAGLYVPQRSSDPGQILRPDQSKVMDMVFVHDVKRDQMIKA